MLELDALSFDFLLTDLDSELGLGIKLFSAVWANEAVKIDELFAFILCRHLVVLMHNFITKVGRVLLVRRNTTIQAGVLQKHDDFFRRWKLFLVRKILVLREQESARFELSDLFLIGSIFSV